MPYLAELVSVSVIAVFMSISPGADFAMVTRNSVLFGRKAGLMSALGVSIAIWIHVFYSIAGLALIISKSLLLFSIVKYLGAAYLIYIGWKTFRSNEPLPINQGSGIAAISSFQALRIGFITNAFNPKTTMFFLSIFTQVVDTQTPLVIQLVYGAIISAAHLLWFSAVAMLLSHPVLVEKFGAYKRKIEKVVGVVLIGFGLKVAMVNHS